MARELNIEIDEDGNVTVDAAGFRGRSCKTVLAEVERLLGRAVERHDKPEIHLREDARARVKR